MALSELAPAALMLEPAPAAPVALVPIDVAMNGDGGQHAQNENEEDVALNGVGVGCSGADAPACSARRFTSRHFLPHFVRVAASFGLRHTMHRPELGTPSELQFSAFRGISEQTDSARRAASIQSSPESVGTPPRP